MVTFERSSCHALLSPNSTQFCTHRITHMRADRPRSHGLSLTLSVPPSHPPLVNSLSPTLCLSLSLSLSRFPLSLARARVYNITIKYIHTHTYLTPMIRAHCIMSYNMLGIWCMTLSCRRCSTRVFKTPYETYLGVVGARSRLRRLAGGRTICLNYYTAAQVYRISIVLGVI